ncbi:MAG: transcription termination/antitermination protein NusG [Planctomycetota bacterium]
MAVNWYAIRVQSNKEDHVRKTLERKIETHGLGDKILKVVVPSRKYEEIKNGKKRTRSEKTYPGYVLVELEMTDETWLFIRETPGVGDFVGVNAGSFAKPFPLTEEEVAKLFGTEEGDGATSAAKPTIKIDFDLGDKVKIKDGPFEDFDGVVDEIIPDKGRIRVTVNIFGRAAPVELEYWQAEKV